MKQVVDEPQSISPRDAFALATKAVDVFGEACAKMLSTMTPEECRQMYWDDYIWDPMED